MLCLQISYESWVGYLDYECQINLPGGHDGGLLLLVLIMIDLIFGSKILI